MRASPPPGTSRPTWAEVDLGAVAHNVAALRGHCPPGTRLMAVIKANGYGHGLVAVARAAVEAGARALGVATTDEGMTLRETPGLGAVTTVVLGPTSPSEAASLQGAGLTFSVGSPEALEHHLALARRRAEPAHIHYQVDTGMGRDGTRHDDLAFLDVLAREHAELDGLWTHLAVSDSLDEDDIAFTNLQLQRFRETALRVTSAGQRPVLHAANSGAVLRHPTAAFHMVRPGISIYGCDPVGPVQPPIPLRGVLSVKSALVCIKPMEEGETVSYGRTYRVASRRPIGIVPMGYGDGLMRSLSNKWKVLIRGTEVPICGRICMDQFMVDLSGVPGAAVGDEVVLVGRQGNGHITLEQMAEAAGTIPYELSCILTRRIPRIYTHTDVAP